MSRNDELVDGDPNQENETVPRKVTIFIFTSFPSSSSAILDSAFVESLTSSSASPETISVGGNAKSETERLNVFRFSCEIHVVSLKVLERVKTEISGSGLQFILLNNPAYKKRPIPDENCVDAIFSLYDKAPYKDGPLAPMKELSLLQVFMESTSLRISRRQRSNDLPSIEIVLVDLSEEEQEFYNQMEAEVKKFIRGCCSCQMETGLYSNCLSVVTRLRQACVDMTLCPSNGYLAGLDDASSKPELLNKLKRLMDEDGENFYCPICLSTTSDAVITSCAHIFCRSCILRNIMTNHRNCPICRGSVDMSDLFCAPPEVASETESSTSTCSNSSKVAALLKLLSASQEEDPRKSVIFSQFRKLLIPLELTLKEAGFKVLRVDDSMTESDRAHIIEEFDVSGPDGQNILVANLKAIGPGVKLTSAAVVYLMEPYLNLGEHESAINRIHCFGGDKINIVRLITRKTIEERMSLLQEKKKKASIDFLL